MDGWQLVTPPARFFYPATGAQGRFVGFSNCDVDVELCSVDGAFYSDDGINWSAATATNNAFADPQGRTILMTAVTPYGDGFVATGSIVDTATQTVVGGVWVSHDGTAWSAVHMPPIDLGSAHNICEGTGYVFGSLFRLATVGRRLLAVGYRDGPRYCHSHREYLALGSADGTTWQPVALPDIGSGGFVSLEGGRQFVMVTQGDARFDIWTSVDGSDWKKGSIGLPKGGGIRAIVETPDGYLAFAGVDSKRPYAQIVLASADGLSWELVADKQLPPDWEPVSQAVLVGNTIVALGGFGHDPDPSDYQGTLYGVAQTTDGMTWTTPETEAFAGYSIWPLISDGTSVLINGERYSDLEEVLFVKSSW